MLYFVIIILYQILSKPVSFEIIGVSYFYAKDQHEKPTDSGELLLARCRICTDYEPFPFIPSPIVCRFAGEGEN